MFLCAVHAHNCQGKNSALYHQGAGNGSGENAEAFWSAIGGVAKQAEHLGLSKFHDQISIIVRQQNRHADLAIPSKCVRMAERSYITLVENKFTLNQLAAHISQHFGVELNCALLEGWTRQFGIGNALKGNSVLGLQGQLYAALTEQKAQLALQVAYNEAFLFEGESISDALLKCESKLKKLQSEINRLRFELGGQVPDFNGDGEAQWKLQRYRQISNEILEKEALKIFHSGKWRRGYNNWLLHNHEKASIRKKIDRLDKSIAHLKTQRAALSIDVNIVQVSSLSAAESGIPVNIKLKAVDVFHVIQRSAEDIGYQIVLQLRSYVRENEARASALESIALNMVHTHETRSDLGEATILREHVLRLRAMAARGTFAIECLPTFPGPDSRLQPWINELVQSSVYSAPQLSASLGPSASSTAFPVQLSASSSTAAEESGFSSAPRSSTSLSPPAFSTAPQHQQGASSCTVTDLKAATSAALHKATDPRFVSTAPGSVFRLSAALCM